MKLHRIILATAITALTFSTFIPVAIARSISTEDFVRQASIANEFEIESSKLALEKSQNKDVKGFAETMIENHTKTGEDLKAALQSSKSGLKIEDKLDGKHQKLMNTLQALSTDDFNKKYVSIQTDAHREAVGLFSDYASNGQDAVLKQFASVTLPGLKEHLKHVKEIKITQ